MNHNLILDSDSYKVSHKALSPDIEGAYSYFESRGGAFDYTVFFGLQALLQQYLAGEVVTQAKLDEAERVISAHMPGNDFFNREGWQHIIDDHGGRLPLRIKAVPEGSVIPTSNILMSVESTCSRCAWVVNYTETFLSRVWYPCTVATLSRTTKETINQYWVETVGHTDGTAFSHHDFGSRGVSSAESAAIGGAAHLVIAKGTDTMVALPFLLEHYAADLDDLAFSIPASEHSCATALGPDGEADVLAAMLDRVPTGLISVVADSYDVYHFVDHLVGERFKEKILARDGTLIVRPDSVTDLHPNPADEMVWILESLWKNFGGTTNELGYRVLNPKVAAIWGDGLDKEGIRSILEAMKSAGFAASNCAFGQGGGLLQRVDRDTARFAYKSSAQKRNGQWHDVWKQPQASKAFSKQSKKGRLSLVEYEGKLITISQPDHPNDILQEVFCDGELTTHCTFAEVRERATL